MTTRITMLPTDLKTKIQNATKGWKIRDNCLIHEYPHSVEVVIEGIDDKGRACCKFFSQRKMR